MPRQAWFMCSRGWAGWERQRTCRTCPDRHVLRVRGHGKDEGDSEHVEHVRRACFTCSRRGGSVKCQWHTCSRVGHDVGNPWVTWPLPAPTPVWGMGTVTSHHVTERGNHTSTYHYLPPLHHYQQQPHGHITTTQHDTTKARGNDVGRDGRRAHS